MLYMNIKVVHIVHVYTQPTCLHIMITITRSCIKFRVILIFIAQPCQMMIISIDLIIETQVAQLINFGTLNRYDRHGYVTCTKPG